MLQQQGGGINATVIVWPTERETDQTTNCRNSKAAQLLSHPNIQQKNADMTTTAIQMLPDQTTNWKWILISIWNLNLLVK